MPTRSCFPLFLAALALTACEAPEGAEPTARTPADSILHLAFAAHGSERLDRAEVEFDFRDYHFVVRRDDGLFRYERHHTDSTGARVVDVLDNEGVRRQVEGSSVVLPADRLASIRSGVNSVVYFALLPYFLDDPAAQKRLLGTAEIDGELFHEIEVTFRPEDGGVDWEDRFVYWIHADRHTMDYLAYEFHVDDGGTRFREAYNVRRVGGVRFADYRNFTSDEISTDVERYDEVRAAGGLQPYSDIALENVEVRSLDS